MHHFKSTIYLLFFCLAIQSCKAQQKATTLPKIENYTKGELLIKASLDGTTENGVEVGKITVDGTIHFNWQNAIVTINEDNYYMYSIKKSAGMSFCNQKEIVQDNENAKAVKIDMLSVYKYGQVVGSLFPATQKEIEDNSGLNRSSSLVLGSTISWIYSDSDVVFNANCTVNQERENSYSFKETTTYNLHLNKGWNIVQNTLLEKEDWKNNNDQGSLPKTISKAIVRKIPPNINWYLKYWANDELLEIEYQLAIQTPITKQQYENWLPKKLGKLKRTDYEIGKTIERMPTINNVYLLFEKGSKKIELTIVDCADNKDAAGVYTLMKDMASRDWKDETETGYSTATKMDDNRVMIDFNEKEVKTTLNYNANERFVIKAEAIDVTPDELWNLLKELNLKDLK
ncbi:hypothetical protein [Winogradskyella sp.]|uniref:hypothetical protein n=1 Tax=Winogradskyella sp. TaxID=1883156 RepID=UPI0025D56755|nr:hypothetical protein [Winogradskyella sp.]